MDSTASYAVAFLFALLVHGIVAALISMNWNQSTMNLSDIKPYYIDATMVAENPYTAKQKRETHRKKSAREQKLHQRRTDEANFRKQQANWQEEQIRKPIVAEATSIPEPEQVLQKAADNDQVDEEEVRTRFEEELSMAVLDEENLRKAVTDDEKAMAYVAQIQREIIANWSRPPSARNGMQAILRVHLVPTGEVVDVKLEESSGNDAFDRSAILAVTKSDRFVVPGDALRFERDFREFTVLFNPDDLRL